STARRPYGVPPTRVLPEIHRTHAEKSGESAAQGKKSRRETGPPNVHHLWPSTAVCSTRDGNLVCLYFEEILAVRVRFECTNAYGRTIGTRAAVNDFASEISRYRKLC